MTKEGKAFQGAELEKVKILKQSVINWIGLLPENVDTDLLYSIIYILNEHKKGTKLWQKSSKK